MTKEKDFVVLVNGEGKVCLITHDEPIIEIDSIGYVSYTGQICIYKKNHPDGDLLEYPLSEDIANAMKSNKTILYVNTRRDTGDIIQEQEVELLEIK